jgi:adenine-specific DNA-methyltransferase
MRNLLDDLTALLARDERLVSDGKLLKNKIVELALALDPALLRLLLGDEGIARRFFSDVDGIKVFDKVEFQRFVSNKQFLPDSYTAFRNRIGLTAGGEPVADGSEVILAWPYQDCLLEGGQTREDSRREEVFWNETLAPDQIDRLLAPKAVTGVRRIEPGGGETIPAAIGEADSLLIKGNNLLALATLRRRYAGKVDVVYIDPPYNPDSQSNTMCYNNRFSRSTWLTFMKNRLEAARPLMKPDGALIVAIDSNEFCYLGVLIETLFPDHEVHCITIVHNPRGVQGTNFSYTHEYAFFVIPRGRKTIGDAAIAAEDVSWSPLRNWGGESERAAAKNCFYPILVDDKGEITGFGDVVPDDVHPAQTEYWNGINHVYPIDPGGVERKWRYARQSVEGVRAMLRAKRTRAGWDIELGKTFGMYRTVWTGPRYDANKWGTQLVKSLVPGSGFNFPKSLWNVFDCLKAVAGGKPDALVLDFFGGSGTTAHAVMELNREDGGHRRFILCEQMDYVETVTLPRIGKAAENLGAGGFLYMELARANEAFVEGVRDAPDEAALRALWARMRETAFLSYRFDTREFDPEADDFAVLPLEEKKAVMLEMLDKNMLYVPLSEMDDPEFGLTDEDRRLSRYFAGEA